MTLAIAVGAARDEKSSEFRSNTTHRTEHMQSTTRASDLHRKRNSIHA